MCSFTSDVLKVAWPDGLAFFWWSDSIFSRRFPSRGLNQSGCTLARILAKYWPLCWQSTLPHKVRVLQSLSLDLQSPVLGTLWSYSGLSESKESNSRESYYQVLQYPNLFKENEAPLVMKIKHEFKESLYIMLFTAQNAFPVFIPPPAVAQWQHSTSLDNE